MDAFLHSIVFTTVAAFTQSLWAETNGRIFLTTFIAYAASYMIYSGYISWFAGGYGGLLLTQVGFSIIDLLGLIPMAFMLLLESLLSWFKLAAKFILLYIILPFALLFIVTNILLTWNIRVFPGSTVLFILGLFMWTGGICLGFSAMEFKERKWLSWLSVGLCYLGAILAGLTAPFASAAEIKATAAPFQSTQQMVANVVTEFTAALLFLFILATPFLAGLSMGSYAAKKKLLSRIQKLVLAQAIEIPGALPAEKEKKKKKATGEENGAVAYEWGKDRPIYLVASLNRMTALYIPAATAGTEKDKLVLLKNELICLMEI